LDAFKILALLLVASSLVLTGCTSQESQDETPVGDLPDWTTYENHIQRPLFDLATSSVDPDHAGQIELESFEMVQVEIQLDPERELPTGYLILEEGRAQLGETLTVQAFVRVDQLLDLSQEPEILYLRAPTRPRR